LLQVFGRKSEEVLSLFECISFLDIRDRYVLV
jgi:hypothetical protein